ncbi:MAG: hypothetical protein ACYSWZ_00500 [Planctomycetota bacterium]
MVDIFNGTSVPNLIVAVNPGANIEEQGDMAMQIPETPERDREDHC